MFLQRMSQVFRFRFLELIIAVRDELTEEFSLVAVDRCASYPAFVQGSVRPSLGVAQGVGELAGDADVVTGPVGGAIVSRGLPEGVGGQGADAGLHGAVVRGGVGGRVQPPDAVLSEKVVHLGRAEAAGVVHLDHQWHAVLDKELE